MDYSDKKIGILGFGVENQALFQWLISHKAISITICDKDDNISKKFPISNFQFPINFQLSNVKFKTGKDYLKNLTDFDVVFRTPGISPLTPELVRAKKKGVGISSEIKLFMDLCLARTIGVTGTKGKGTTSSLIFEILKSNFQFLLRPRSGRAISNFQTNIQNLIPKTKIYLGGNIGNAPIEFLDKLTKDDVVVLELSSFQLMDLEKSPNIAVVLDIESDHLDYHKNRTEYVSAKENIVRHQSKKDYTVINLDYLTSYKFAAISKTENNYYFSRRKSVDLGTYVEWTPINNGANFGKIILRTPKKDYEICKTYDIILRGEHNLENITAAITASYLAGASVDVIKKVVVKFPGLEHRLEYVGDSNGVKFYNDSFSTTPETAIAAIKSFSEPIVLIAGGSEKGADYSLLAKEILNSSVKTLIAIGVTGPKIIKAISYQLSLDSARDRSAVSKKIKIIKDLRNMKKIIKIAVEESKQGDIVLLSPASASFGLFKNYKDRGNQFREEVGKIT
jgi:UDP-N-acetylmuramoylalanine--D-glutamate ligase